MTETLSTEDVLLIHEILVRDFANTPDPISPPGVKDLGLLESAVSRQHVSFAGREKYATPLASAATLTFGICNNHPFYNGNKRTSLVAMLAHLDKNALTLIRTRQKELHDLIMAVAQHEIVALVRGKQKASRRPGADEEVEAVTQWLQARAEKPRRGEKQITYRELSRILRTFRFELRIPKSGRGNQRDIVKYEERTAGIFKKRIQKVEKRIGSVGYRDEGTFVSIKDLKYVRKLCCLREEDGIPSSAFYDNAAVIDKFVNEYRGVLRRLGKK